MEILPLQIFCQQLCSRCNNLLSVGPVGRSPSGIFCGRCRPNSTAEMYPSLFNKVAEHYAFKCINRYKGCTKLIPLNDGAEHEENCKFDELQCPFCMEFKGNGCQLVNHFQLIHDDYIVKNGIFAFDYTEAGSRNLIFLEDNNIICLVMNITINFTEIFSLSITTQNAVTNKFGLRFFSPGTSLEFVTPLIKTSTRCSALHPISGSSRDDIFTQNENCFIFKHAVLNNYFSGSVCFARFDVYLGNEKLNNNKLEKFNDLYVSKISLKDIMNIDTVERLLKMSDCERKIFVEKQFQTQQVCSNCNKYIRSDVYFCPEFHIACSICITRQCKRCNKYQNWSNSTKLHKLLFPCDWSGCQVQINIFSYLSHKQQCEFRQYNCPDVNCEYVGIFDNFKQHWHLGRLNRVSEIYIRIGEESGHYWMPSNTRELLFISYKTDKLSNCLLVTINEGLSILCQRYSLLLTSNYNPSYIGPFHPKRIYSKEQWHDGANKYLKQEIKPNESVWTFTYKDTSVA